MPLSTLLAALRDAPSRTGSVIITVYGDAVAPRGGEIALASLLELMGRIRAGDGVVRTAVSRLMRDGWLNRHRIGRRSFYRLAPRGLQEFADATPRIYGRQDSPWTGQLRLVFAEAGVERSMLEAAGYALLAPGLLAAPDSALVPPPGLLALLATGNADSLRTLAARTWPVGRIARGYAMFSNLFLPLAEDAAGLNDLDAMAARVLLVHEYRRIALRDPRLPLALLPVGWPGVEARELCIRLYGILAPASERWLDTAENRSGTLPRGPDPATRFSGGGK